MHDPARTTEYSRLWLHSGCSAVQIEPGARAVERTVSAHPFLPLSLSAHAQHEMRSVCRALRSAHRIFHFRLRSLPISRPELHRHSPRPSRHSCTASPPPLRLSILISKELASPQKSRRSWLLCTDLFAQLSVSVASASSVPVAVQ